MSQEYRHGLVKQLGQMSEHTKGQIRHVRQDARSAIKKLKHTSQDETRRLENSVRILVEIF